MESETGIIAKETRLIMIAINGTFLHLLFLSLVTLKILSKTRSSFFLLQPVAFVTFENREQAEEAKAALQVNPEKAPLCAEAIDIAS